MNELFVNVKVDREERPDVDQIYMDAVTGLTGHGGWPLTAFCTPDGRLFYGGTYFPPEARHGMPAFRDVLTRVADAYRSRRGEVEQNAAHIMTTLGRRAEQTDGDAPGAATAARAAFKLLQSADPDHGGFGGAPKFPTPTSLELLLAATDVLPERKAGEALDHVVRSCIEMARGGVYDQLGGGFHRYSVDAHWGVPHFEKMLYDQGQLLSVYAEAWRRGGGQREELLWPIRETVVWLRREMVGSEGGFFASQDADSEGEEGTFYVWTPAQVADVLGDAAADFCRAYGVSERGNFESGATVLRDVARAERSQFADQREALRRAREQRVAPDTDRKRVAAWNGLMISGLARSSALLADPSLLEDAVAAADFVWQQMRDERGQLLRVWAEGRAHIPAFLDDEAAMLAAGLDLQRAGADDRFLTMALSLADDIATRFFDEDEGDLFLTPSDGEALAHRPRSDHDGATPHSTGLAVHGLLRAANLAGRDDLRKVADRVISSYAFALERTPHAHPSLCRALLARERGLSVAVIVGPPDDALTRALADRARRVLAPDDAVIVAAPGATPPPGVDPSWLANRDAVNDRATAYVCRGRSCSLPTSDPDALVPLDATAT
jgi:hypothetical protein